MRLINITINALFDTRNDCKHPNVMMLIFFRYVACSNTIMAI